jgi:hypothetical protein
MEDALQAPVVRQDHVISVQRRRMQIANWAAGTHVTRGIDPGPDRSGQVLTLLCFLLTVSLRLVRLNCPRDWLDFVQPWALGTLEIWLLVALIGIVTL